MIVIFRAEIMPGKSREDRSFRIKKVLENGPVILYNLIGEHRRTEFEPVSFNRSPRT